MKKKYRLLQSDSLWAACAILLIVLQFWWLPGENGSAADSYSNTVDGKLGLYRTLVALFPEVRRDAVSVVPESNDTFLIIAPDRYPTEAEQQRLYQFVTNGGNLLFAPRWMVSASPAGDPPDVTIPSLGIRISSRSWFEDAARRVLQRQATGTTTTQNVPAEVSPSGDATETVQSQAVPIETSTTDEIDPVNMGAENSAEAGNAAKGTSKSDATGTPQPDPAAVDPAAVDLLLNDEDYGEEIFATSTLSDGDVSIRTTGRVILPNNFETKVLMTSGQNDVDAATWVVGSGRVVVCSTADLFSNRSMLFRDSRRLAVRLVEECASGWDHDRPASDATIVIGEYYNASDSYQNTGVLFSPAMRVGSLQLILVAVLSIWMAFHRFGPAEQVTSLQRRSLTESAEAVGNLQYRLRDGGAVIRGYMEYIRSQLRRRYGNLLRLDESEAIANRAGMDPAEVKAQLSEAAELERTDALSSAKTASMLRWLSHLQRRLSGRRDAD